MWRIVRTAAWAGNVGGIKMLPNGDIRTAFGIDAITCRRTSRRSPAARLHVHSILATGIRREFNLRVVGLSRGTIGKRDENPIATRSCFDFAREIDCRTNGDVDRTRRSAGIGVDIGCTFATIIYGTVDVGKTRLTRIHRAGANRTGPIRHTASAWVLRSARRIGIRFVELPIAIVVEAVADFGRWVIVAIADEHTARARRRSRRANTVLASGARNAATRIAIVGSAIAIVVEAVAYLGAGVIVAIANDSSCRTSRRPR